MAAPIGLDIGSSAVRVAEVTTGRRGVALTRFGQVALPAGAVVDGEVRDRGVVSQAVSQVFKRSKVGRKRAVVGVANQRVVVRQLELPYLEEKEFRSALRFQVADQIPMPVEEAELDFQVLGDYTTEAGDHLMSVLLVAAATDMVEQFVGVLTDAAVEPAGVDLTPFAVARAVSPAARGETGTGGGEAIIDVGAGVTNILVHFNGEARFVRILLVGGDDATRALSEALDVSPEEAEAIKLDLGRGVGTPEAQRILQERIDYLIGEIRGSLDYYMSQEESEGVSSTLVTGGGAAMPRFVERLAQAVGISARRASPFADIHTSRSGLTGEQLAQVEPVAAAAIGLAMGTTQR
jgi:type IV pilus assembly protein PilM